MDSTNMTAAAPSTPLAAQKPDAGFITLTQVTKVFKTASEELCIIDHLDAAVARASSVVITGESGSGKTTLLHMIAAIDKPSSGSIVINGLDVAAAKESELSVFRNRFIGLVFQFHYLLKEFSALENVMLPARMAGLKESQARDRALTLLDDVGLSSRSSHFPTQLSGGERQRVALARALMNDPQLVLADEPTGNLDERNASQVEQLLFSLSRKYGKTLLLVTHNQSIAKEADVHWHLRLGRFVDTPRGVPA